MKVLVYYELRTQCVAEVDYDDLAEAWNEDAKAWGAEKRGELPSQDRLLEVQGRGFGTIRIDEHADGNVDQLLVTEGSEADSSLAFITEIGVAK